MSYRRRHSAERRRFHTDEAGLTALEWLGVFAIIVAVLAFIPPVRALFGDTYDAIFKQIDPDTGQVTAFSVATRGVLITVAAIIAFIGSGYLLLYTDLGARLAFLVTGAATFGWLVIGSTLFVVYAPRGLRPSNVEGLNAFQIRVPSIALTLGSLILFLMFVAALDRYENEAEESA